MTGFFDDQTLDIPCGKCGHQMPQTVGRLKQSPKLPGGVGMRVTAGLVGLEFLWLLCGCVLGMQLWMGVASFHNEAADLYWAANGQPPPLGMHDSPKHLRFVLLFAPYAPTRWPSVYS